jgi:HSP20 family protein
MMIRYSPAVRWPDFFTEARRLQENMNNLFGNPRQEPRTEFPPVNVWVGADGVVLAAEVPGQSPDQIDLTVHQDTVTLRGERKPEPLAEDAVVHRRERVYGPFSRTVVLPFRVDAEKVSAKFDRGVLKLELPRPESDKPRHVKIARG